MHMKKEIERVPIDLLSVGLFLFIVMISGLAIKAADWADDLEIIAAVGVIGGITGIFLARSTFSWRVAILFGSVYGIFLVGWEIGRTLDKALIWRDKISGLLGRIGVFIGVITSGETNKDPLIFVLLIALLFWILGCFGVWWIFRREGFWAAVLPLGIAILVNQYFYVGRSKLEGYLILYILIILLLAVRLVLWRQQMLWREIRAHVPENVTFHISRVGVILAVLLVVVAWGGPAFAESDNLAKVWAAIVSPFTKVQEKIGDVLGGLRTAAIVTSDYYTDVLQLKAGVTPEDILIMYVTPERLPNEQGRFYWLSRVYNEYEDGEWFLTIGEKYEHDPNMGDLPEPEYLGREEIGVTFEPKLPAIHRLSVPSHPVWINRTIEAEVLTLLNEEVDVLTITTTKAIFNGDSYDTRASVAIPTADELREASDDLPEWIVNNYLHLPEETTVRTKELALRITEGQETTYDKAIAITNWLRHNIEYSRETIPPPPDVERIDWFLFDYQVGFCNWYASAEVVMLRSLGIPARLAVGFARGDFIRELNNRGSIEAEEGYYEVRGEDAHAWPEVYFPGYGWVEFEPTVNQPNLIRPEPVEAQDRLNTDIPTGPEFDEGAADRLNEFEPIDGFTLDQDEGLLFGGMKSYLLLLILGVLIAIVVLIALWLFLDPISRVTAIGRVVDGLQKIGVKPPPQLVEMRMQDLSSIGKIYARWCIWLRRLDVGLSPTQTPNERAELFSEIYPEAADRSWNIVNAYTEERFGGYSSKVQEVYALWHDLRSFLWLEWIKHKLEFILHRHRRSRLSTGSTTYSSR
jgi:transglutaminase-like putative cysteine protease